MFTGRQQVISKKMILVVDQNKNQYKLAKISIVKKGWEAFFLGV